MFGSPFRTGHTLITAKDILKNLSSEYIPIKIIHSMTALEAKTYIGLIEQNIEKNGCASDVDKVNLQALRSSINGPSQSAARAYAPVGFHK